MDIKEAKLRDLLIEQISIFGEGITFVKKEQYIPNDLGTRGFIDILAKNAEGHYVLIEVKRSNSASREAIHEILKYVEGVKKHLGLRDDEIQTIIASTEWKELLVPFTRFVAETTINTKGFKLHISESGNLSAVAIKLKDPSLGRFIAPWHEIRMYLDEASLARGLQEYEVCCKKKGIEDYILLTFSAPPGFYEYSKRATANYIAQMRQNTDADADLSDIPSLVDKMDDYKYIIYYGMQQLSKEEYLSIIETDSVVWEELQDYYTEAANNEDLMTLHEAANDTQPWPHNDYLEISTPAKFKKILDDEGWKLLKVHRYGSFARNSSLSDSDIIHELRGGSGEDGNYYDKNFLSNKTQLATIRKDIKRCLENNSAWRANILQHLDEIEKDYPQTECKIKLYHPSAGLMTIYLAVITEGGVFNYTPTYTITVNPEQPIRMYFGCLVSEGEAKSLKAIIEKFYEGRFFNMVFAMNWGGYESQDFEILEDAGLTYKSFKCDADKDKRSFYKFKESRWRPIEPFIPYEPFIKYIDLNEAFVEELVTEVSKLWDGVMVREQD